MIGAQLTASLDLDERAVFIARPPIAGDIPIGCVAIGRSYLQGSNVETVLCICSTTSAEFRRLAAAAAAAADALDGFDPSPESRRF
jgi:hypothetical protein